MLKLIGEREALVCVSKMKDGDIAVIVGWDANMYVGQIVQRYRDDLINIGAPFGKGWSGYFKDTSTCENCQVRILKRGEMLFVE